MPHTTPQSQPMKGTEVLCHALMAEGVDTIFGYPGGSIMPFYDRLYDFSDSLRHILVRHEQGAIHAAQGYARASGKVGVVTVTSGPGATNIITGLADAQIDSTPLVVITGQVGVASLGTDAFQETDLIGITLPITKWAYQIRSPHEIAWAVARAFYIASTGRPGPVVLDFTKDAQLGTTDFNYSKINYIRSYNPSPELSPATLAEVAELINGAHRPMIFAGHGVTIAHAEEQLRQLAEKAEIPVATTLLGLSALPTAHPLNMGMLGMHGNLAPNVKTNEADVILAIGMRFDDRVTGRIDRYAPQAHIIHVDIDAAEFDKNIVTASHVHSDAGRFLRQLLPLVQPATHTEWVKGFDLVRAVELQKVIHRELHPELPTSSGPMRMGQVVNAVSHAAGPNALVVTDVGQNQMMTARYFSHSRERSFISSGGLGTMGFCIPAAVGAKLGAPHRHVIAFMGDGGFQMTMQELGTIMEYRLPVKLVILNNNFLGNVRQWQALFYSDRFMATPMLNPDFVTIASAYGIRGENVECADQLREAVDRMIASDGPYLLNVNIEAADMIFPMIAPGSAIDEIMLTPTECYANIVRKP